MWRMETVLLQASLKQNKDIKHFFYRFTMPIYLVGIIVAGLILTFIGIRCLFRRNNEQVRINEQTYTKI